MSVFSPNIRKLKEEMDIDGLVKALSNTKVCSEAIKASVELRKLKH
jgi:hypothetical protein